MLALIEVKSLFKVYGKKVVLKDLDFYANENDRVFILAPNGYGKTTFLKVLANVESFQGGEICIKGSKVPSVESRKNISYIGERDNFYPNFKIKESVKFFAGFYRLNVERFERFISILKLDENKRLSELSKGERTLIRVAIGLSLNVPIYLIDEPLSSLDFVLREKIVGMLHEMEGGTFIFTSHQIDEIEPFANRFVFLKDGKFVVETEDRENIKDIYRELFS